LLLAARGPRYLDCRAPGAKGCRDPVVRKRDSKQQAAFSCSPGNLSDEYDGSGRSRVSFGIESLCCATD
jgi:hypothetical protein